MNTSNKALHAMVLIIGLAFLLAGCYTQGAGCANGFVGVGGDRPHAIKGPRR